MELKHYGILGMKWGVRRTPEQLGHKTSKKPLSDKKKKTNNKLNSTIAKGKEFVEKFKKYAPNYYKITYNMDVNKREFDNFMDTSRLTALRVNQINNNMMMYYM